MQDVAASLVRPVRELKAYQRVTLAPGAEQTVTLTLPKRDMGFYDSKGNYRLEDGLFRLYVGGSSRDTLMQEISICF